MVICGVLSVYFVRVYPCLRILRKISLSFWANRTVFGIFCYDAQHAYQTMRIRSRSNTNYRGQLYSYTRFHTVHSLFCVFTRIIRIHTNTIRVEGRIICSDLSVGKRHTTFVQFVCLFSFTIFRWLYIGCRCFIAVKRIQQYASAQTLVQLKAISYVNDTPAVCILYGKFDI